MLAFACPRCGILVQVPEHAAGKKVRCGGCHQVVDAPQTATALTGAFAAPHQVPGGPRPVEDRPTLPPHGADAGPASAADRELYDFLAPPHGPGELGRLGPYRVLRVLGSGGMGVVFEAEDTQLHRPVALKALLPALAASAAARERFLREARAAAAVAHDHVVTIYQVGEDRGIPFLAMQLLRGETLEARLRREKRLPAAEVIRLGREIAEGLAAAHARGLIHRDVKPSNVWLEAGTGRVKLLDFGLALAAGADTRLTQTGALVGTLGYLAPEQTRPGPPDPRADLFALGCVLYRLTTGVLPFRGTDALSTLSALATEVPRPVRELNPQVPPPLSDLITRLLSKDPAGRPPSAQAVVLALSALGARPAPAARPVPGPDPEPPVVAEEVAVAPSDTSPLGRVARRPRPGCLLGAVVAGVAGAAALGLLVTGILLLAWSRGVPGKPTAAERPEPFASVQAGVQAHKYTEHDSKGGAFGAKPYRDVLPEGGLLIGFEVGVGHFTPGHEEIDYLRPIYRTGDQETMGQGIGKPTDRMKIIKAKPGYAVGALTVHGGAVLDGFAVTFLPVGRHGLKREGAYKSEWIGGAWQGEDEVIDGDGAFVVGVCGRLWDGGKPSSLGPVLFRPDPD